jgi:hypothetical protein
MVDLAGHFAVPFLSLAIPALVLKRAGRWEAY